MKKITLSYVNKVIAIKKNGIYPVPKWLIFCSEMLKSGFEVSVYYAKSTVSKYIHITRMHKRKRIKLKIRFSNHKPNKRKEDFGDCDYFVGRSNNGVITTEEVIEQIKKRTGLLNNKKKLYESKFLEEPAICYEKVLSDFIYDFYTGGFL